MKFCVLIVFLFEFSQVRDSVSFIPLTNLRPIIRVDELPLNIVGAQFPIYQRPPFPPFGLYPPTGQSTGWGVFPTTIPGTVESGCCSCRRVPYLNCFLQILLNDTTLFGTTISDFEKATKLVPCFSLLDADI